jgi:hypothetical protein
MTKEGKILDRVQTKTIWEPKQLAHITNHNYKYEKNSSIH